MNINIRDTIAAISTPRGVGAIGIVRLSGSESVAIADAVFDGRVDIQSLTAQHATFGNIVDNMQNGELIDEVVLTKFQQPHSYTGEDIVEIACHGGILVTQNILELLLRNGARLAEPGEFTKRAFINGKLDLVQAESVADIIHAQTNKAQRLSIQGLQGHLSEQLEALKSSIKQQCILLETELDFSEEDIEFAERGQLLSDVDKLVINIDELLKSFRYGKILREGINLAIVGKPNVGKSSILNRLVDEERAIVSETPGTTRDVIEESLDIQGFLFKISDTAGVRSTSDHIEHQGVERTKAVIHESDIALFVLDASMGLTDEDIDIADLLQSSSIEETIVLNNKIDLYVQSDISSFFEQYPFERILNTSVKTGEGFEELKQHLVSIVQNQQPVDSGIVLSRVRHRDALIRAKNHLVHARESLSQGFSSEFVSLDLRASLDAIGEVTGEVTTDDIVNEIFSKFCIGK